MGESKARPKDEAVTTTFRRYDHLERLGHRDVEGILHGTVHVFPKIDGTNGSVWFNEDKREILCASRNRVLATGDDNQGFSAWFYDDDQINVRDLCYHNPAWIFYGEWLVKHTIGDYREDAWRRFYIFDVYDRETGRYLSYDEYALVLSQAGVDYIPPACTVADPSEDQLIDMLEHNFYLMQDGKGAGEGIVIKNYAWSNLYNRQPWAKIVRTMFKDRMMKEQDVGARKGRLQTEIAIADEVVTEHLVRKELAKVVYAIGNENFVDVTKNRIEATDDATKSYILQTYRKRVIPWILQQVYYCVIDEELWTQLKKYRNPTIDFKALQGRVTYNTKKHLPELF